VVEKSEVAGALSKSDFCFADQNRLVTLHQNKSIANGKVFLQWKDVY